MKSSTFELGRPLHMSPVNRAGSVTEMKLVSVHMVMYKKTVHNKTTSYLEIRNHVSFKTAFKIKNHNNTRVLNVQFVGGQKTCDHVM